MSTDSNQNTPYMARPIPKKPLRMVDLQSIAKMTLSTGERELLAKGVSLFKSGEFWKAHEVWEEIWLAHPEDGRFFIQGLIQLAAAFHQLRRGIYRGFEIHLKNARARIELFPPRFLGIDVEDLRKRMGELMKLIEGKGWPPERNSDQIPPPAIQLSIFRDHGTE